MKSLLIFLFSAMVTIALLVGCNTPAQDAVSGAKSFATVKEGTYYTTQGANVVFSREIVTPESSNIYEMLFMTPKGSFLRVSYREGWFENVSLITREQAKDEVAKNCPSSEIPSVMNRFFGEQLKAE